MGAAIGLIGTAVSAVGTIAGGAAANQAGQYQANALEFQAKQYELQASDARASGQRSDFEKRREGRFAESALTARAAAGGGSATDPTALNILGDIAGRSEYLALTEGFKGENKARGFEDAAKGARYSAGAAIAGGQTAQTASYLGAGGTILSGLGSAYSQNKGIPTGTSPLASTTPLGLSPLNYRNKFSVG
jgi:hypothetical protein